MNPNRVVILTILACSALVAPVGQLLAAPLLFLDTTDNGNGIDGFNVYGSVGGIDTTNWHALESVDGGFQEDACDPVTAVKRADDSSPDLIGAAGSGQLFDRIDVHFFSTDPLSGATYRSQVWGLIQATITNVSVSVENLAGVPTVVDTLTIVPEYINVITGSSVVVAMLDCKKR